MASSMKWSRCAPGSRSWSTRSPPSAPLQCRCDRSSRRRRSSSGGRPEEAAMRLSTKGRYAVMAMVDLAKHGKGNPISLADIAERQEISLSYLEQLFAKLRAGELVKSVRGPGGGYLLSRGADGTRISDIIVAVDEPIRATRCLTHDLWEELGHQIHLYLSSVTLADVVEGRVLGTSRVMVEEPRPPAPA